MSGYGPPTFAQHLGQLIEQIDRVEKRVRDMKEEEYLQLVRECERMLSNGCGVHRANRAEVRAGKGRQVHVVQTRKVIHAVVRSLPLRDQAILSRGVAYCSDIGMGCAKCCDIETWSLRGWLIRVGIAVGGDIG